MLPDRTIGEETWTRKESRNYLETLIETTGPGGLLVKLVEQSPDWRKRDGPTRKRREKTRNDKVGGISGTFGLQWSRGVRDRAARGKWNHGRKRGKTDKVTLFTQRRKPPPIGGARKA